MEESNSIMYSNDGIKMAAHANGKSAEYMKIASDKIKTYRGKSVRSQDELDCWNAFRART
jgi:hypothetical protein